jgi:hypothetical protein
MLAELAAEFLTFVQKSVKVDSGCVGNERQDRLPNAPGKKFSEVFPIIFPLRLRQR